MDMLRLSILMKRITSTNVGSVTQKENFMYTKIILLMGIVILTSSCTEFAVLSSGAGIAASNNAYAKAYSGIDFLTVIKTEKDIKMHAYDALTKGKND
jgi:hypothetical protein|tara:strand:- start:2741 stop:3034 length:294 start_codon:yes stop_codon:yes gene_type:complete